MKSTRYGVRRSSRRSNHKMVYAVGDIVEIKLSADEIGRGTLVAKANRGTVNPKWKVVFKGQSIDDQELYESSFGPVLSQSAATTPEPQRREAVTPENNNGDQDDSSVPSSKATRSTSPKDSTKRKAVSFEAPQPDSKPNPKLSPKSAREERSKRRRANQEKLESKKALKKLPKDVVQIPMLTGTLLLFKGKKRRAEFIRHV